MRVLVSLLLLLFAPAAWAGSSVVNAHARVDLFADTSGAARTLGVRITPASGWHSYWRNPGEAGAENRLAWTLPPGASAGPPAYPVPEPLLVQGIMNHVYAHPVTLLVDVAHPAPGPVALRLDYLVCSADLCVPERADLSFAADAPPDAAAIEAARAALPRPLAGARFTAAPGRLALSAPVPGSWRAAHFFPGADGAIIYSAPQTVEPQGGALRLETKRPPNAPTPARIVGLLRVERPGGSVSGYSIDATPAAAPLAGAGPQQSTPTGGGFPSGEAPAFLATLALAVAGGLLLNVMPCVFPILSLKALALARGHVTPADARAEARAYALGAVVTTTALGGVILALRAAGTAAGWAFQLQDPRVIAGLLLLMTAIALNLAGVFEVSLGGASTADRLSRRSGFAGGFFTGALAAFVATPCSGPFMAAALGAALVLPPAQGLIVFAGLGLGLAIPFVLVGYSPALRRRLPHPGPWMARLRHLLSVPMFSTALALAWVLGRQAGVAGMTAGLAAALALGLALWWAGTRQRDGGAAWVALVPGIAVALAALSGIAPASPVVALAASGPLGARPFSEAALAGARAARRPAFVYLTADWCITCKVNERGAMADASVASAFARGNVAVFEGDWTRADPVLTRFLAAQGRSGVPLYVFYHADGRVELLPQLLTAARLRALVERSGVEATSA